MAEKTVSIVELQKLAESGAKIVKEQRPMVIEQFSELVDQFKKMIAALEARVTADLKRSQTQLEVLAILQSQIKQNTGRTMSAPIDLKPLETVLSEIQEATRHHEPYDYEFTFDRSNQGFATKIHAKVVRPTFN